MKWVVVILKEPGYYLTLGTVRYNRWGDRNQQSIITCQSWTEGFSLAKEQGFEYALFVKSGTVFLDWAKWCDLINAYPHRGLVGHIIWHPGQRAYLDDQCWFMDLTKFDLDDFALGTIQQPVPVRSEKNLHDDYTPMWIKPADSIETFDSKHFGQGLIARQLNSKQFVVNWNNAARDIKHFEYTQGNARLHLKDYIDLAENQFWVFNNEPIAVEPTPHLVTPGSGLYWILHKCHSDVKTIDIVDISRTQVDWCRHLQDNWDGHNYGQFAWDYIKQNNLVHYELERAGLDNRQRLHFKNQQFFVEHVNTVFDQLTKQAGITDFGYAWTNSKCQVNIAQGNLVEYSIPKGARVWMSNILDYKYTLITTDHNTLLNYENATKP